MLENPYEPPVATDPDRPSRRPHLAWLASVIAWLPALLVLGFVAPKFIELFDQLRERAELPALSSGVLDAATFSQSLFHLPIALFLAGLIASDVAIAEYAERRKSSAIHKLLQAAICVCGLIAALVITIGLLLPIIRMAPTI